LITSVKNQLRRLLPGNTFARGVSVLVGGTAGAQLLTVLAAPLLTRLYSPEDFGLLAAYTSLLILINVVSSLRYELAIPLPKDDDEAANVAILSLILVGCSTILTSILIIQLRQTIANLLDVSVLAKYLWLLPVGVLFGGAYSVFNYWSIRTERFSTMATSKLRQAITTITIQLTMYKLGVIALLLGQVGGQSVSTATLGRSTLVSGGFSQVTLRKIYEVAGRYRRFPILSTWEGLANQASSQLPTIMLLMFFTPSSAGLYALANRVLALPISIIGNAIGDVFFSTAAGDQRREIHAQLLEKCHANLANLGFPPALVLILIGPDFFAFIFGEEWREAGDFARWMTPWFCIAFISSPLSTLIAVTEKLKEGMTFQLILLCSRMCAIFYGVWLGDLRLTIIFFSAISTVCYCGLLIFLARIVGTKLNALLKQTFKATGTAVFCTTPLLITLMYDGSFTVNTLSYALPLSLLLIVTHYWRLLRKDY
jgi:O-antigen/teichoic acid export membrane protein